MSKVGKKPWKGLLDFLSQVGQIRLRMTKEMKTQINNSLAYKQKRRETAEPVNPQNHNIKS